MIGSLRGTVLHRDDGTVVVEVSGVGYEVVVTPATAVAVGEPGGPAFLWTHHHLRDDAETLYGFMTRDELVTFRTLLSAHGVGPSLALAILSVHTPTDLARALADDDVGALCLVPGVGKKTAARLLVELKSRLRLPEPDAVPAGIRPNGSGSAPSVRADVREALAGLGYSAEEIRAATADLPDGDASELLRAALARLAAGAQR